MRGLVDRAVEGPVGHQVMDAGIAQQRLYGLEGLPDAVDVFAGTPFGSPRGSQWVEREPDLEEIAGLLGGQVGHPCVSVGIELDQALGLESPHRLT